MKILKFFKKQKRTNITVLSELFEITRGINPYDALRGQSKRRLKLVLINANFKDDTFVPEIRGKTHSKIF
jgi:hypothetical protein